MLYSKKSCRNPKTAKQEKGCEIKMKAMQHVVIREAFIMNRVPHLCNVLQLASYLTKISCF